jgi:hypothetical protein
MNSMKRLYRSFSRLAPKGYRRSIKDILKYSGKDTDAEIWVGKYIFIGFVMSLLSYIFLSFVIMINVLLTILVVIILFILIQILPRIFANMGADKRSNFVEEILPDALLLMASNMRSGMTPDRAIMLSAREEFGALETELRNVAKKAMSGERLDTALLEMTRTIKSEILDRTINLLVQGLRSGGEFASLLEQVALDIKDMQILRKEVRASVMMYSIFILIAAGLGAPALFAVSTYLIEQITSMSSGLDIPDIAMSNMPFSFSFSAPPVSPRFLFYFALACMLITSIFASMVMGLIQSAKARDGFKYIPILMIMSFGLFFVARGAIASIMGSMALF